MKLLLTSTGLANKSITDKFLELTGKPATGIKIIFVPTASRTEHELKYVQKSRQQLLDLGILGKNIKDMNLDKKIAYSEVRNYDVIYVCGGNSFFLLKKVRESGFDEIIKEFVKNNKLYFGVSAGSLLVCPDISIASPCDENDVGITDLTGLNLIDVIVSPHYCEKERQLIEDFRKKSKIQVIPLTDNQALLVLNNSQKIIE